MQAFNVYLKNKQIDKIFYGDNTKVDKEEVKKSLVNHDGYDSGIRVTKERKKKFLD